MVNTSDRQIVDTGTTESTAGDFRVPEVLVIGQSLSTSPPESDQSPDSGTGSTGTIGVPRNIELESQTVRIQPDGSAVIDVELSFEPAEDADKHEIRITKL